MKITDLGEMHVASAASMRYEPPVQLTDNEKDVVTALVKMGCSRFQSVDAVVHARAAGARDEYGSLIIRARDPVRSSVFTFPNGVPIFQDLNPDASEPIELEKGFWAFQRNCYRVEDAELMPVQEIALRIKHVVYGAADRAKRELERIQQEVDAFTNPGPSPTARADREHIPQSVKHSVWRRDLSRCVQCGSNVRLEFDHIIPVVKGGSSTERNIQLLCEKCNRRKGKTL
jgi:hypothetical protein